MEESKALVYILFMNRGTWFFLFFFFSFSLYSQNQGVNKGLLEEGEPQWGHLREHRGQWVPDMWTIRVDDRIRFMNISLLKGEMDFDLYLSHGTALLDYIYAPVSAESEFHLETLELSRYWSSQHQLKSGTYYLYVVGRGPEGQSGAYQIQLKTRNQREAKKLELDSSQSGSLLGETGMMDFFHFQIDEEMDSFRIDLSGAKMDLDLYLNKGAPASSYDDVEHIKASYLANEHLILRKEDRPLKGNYFLTVWGQQNHEHPEEIKVYLSRGDKAPASILPYPNFFSHPLSGSGSFERAVKGTVEITSAGGLGSGAVLTPGGLILTNWHVVKGFDGRPSQEIYVGLNLDLSLPPQVLFKGDVVFYEPQRDLALVQIRKGALDQPLPRNFRLHYFDPSFEDPQLGDTLFVTGFPVTGGSGSRTSLSLTKGVLVGFESTAFGTILKTDAQINSGNSGGPAFGPEGRLLALPTSVRGLDSGQLAFLHPLSLLPTPWLEHWSAQRVAQGLPPLEGF